MVSRIGMEVVHAKPPKKGLDVCRWDHRFNKPNEAQSMLIDESSNM